MNVYRLKYYSGMSLRDATARWCSTGHGIPFAVEIPESGTVICNLPEYQRRYARAVARFAMARLL